VLKLTGKISLATQPLLCRRPSQKVKVLKLAYTAWIENVNNASQTFSEGKGVETRIRVCPRSDT